MQIKTIKAEVVDKNSRLLVKRIATPDGEFLNRKLSVSNFVYILEKKRLNYDKSLFSSPIQTYHIRYDKIEKKWDLSDLNKIKIHAEGNRRILFPYKQRNEKQVNALNWNEVERDVIEIADKKVDYVPVVIPKNTELKEWRRKRKDFSSMINNNQKIFPIFSSKHMVDKFYNLVKYEMNKKSIIGITSYEFIHPNEISNLSKVGYLNSLYKVGEECPLITYFGYPRILIKHSYVGGAFAFNCFAGDIFSERACYPVTMSKESINKMMERKPEDFYFYDPHQKGFNKSIKQESWYGIDLTKNLMSEIDVGEGLSGYDAIRWVNHGLQQKDLNVITDNLLLKKNIIRIINNYSRWSVFWQRNVEPTLDRKNKNLDEF